MARHGALRIPDPSHRADGTGVPGRSYSYKSTGVLGCYPCTKARVFPALPPLDPRPGYSRPFPLVPEHGRSRLCLRFSDEKDPHRFVRRASWHATVQTRGPIHASRTARRRPSANRFALTPGPASRLHVRASRRTRPVTKT